MKSNPKFAPYLIINGNRVKFGATYFSVYKHTLKIIKHKAGSENNTSDREYFLNENSAKEYVVLNSKVFSLNDIQSMFPVNFYKAAEERSNLIITVGPSLKLVK